MLRPRRPSARLCATGLRPQAAKPRSGPRGSGNASERRAPGPGLLASGLGRGSARPIRSRGGAGGVVSAGGAGGSRLRAGPGAGLEGPPRGRAGRGRVRAPSLAASPRSLAQSSLRARTASMTDALLPAAPQPLEKEGDCYFRKVGGFGWGGGEPTDSRPSAP